MVVVVVVVGATLFPGFVPLSEVPLLVLSMPIFMYGFEDGIVFVVSVRGVGGLLVVESLLEFSCCGLPFEEPVPWL